MKVRPTLRWPIPGSSRIQKARPFSVTTTLSSRLRARLDIPPPFPVTQTCPEPSCSCPTPTPSMPEGLPIDYAQPLNGTMAAYAQQLVICTGQRDWTSRIENDGEDQGWGELARGLKRLMGRGGRYQDPFNNILVTNSSFPASTNASTASAFLFPSFKYFPSVPVNVLEQQTSETDLSTFVRAFLLPTKLNPMQEALPEPKQAELIRVPDLAPQLPAIDIQHSLVVLICGHGGRDMRCGVMAPALETEFARVLQSRGFSTEKNETETEFDRSYRAHIGLISHIGGHKYAGNVIVYIPPGMMLGSSSTPHPLAGKGIWYGRIEPRNVEGVVEETILGGKVVVDHFRGGIGRNGEILRL